MVLRQVRGVGGGVAVAMDEPDERLAVLRRQLAGGGKLRSEPCLQVVGRWSWSLACTQKTELATQLSAMVMCDAR